MGMGGKNGTIIWYQLFTQVFGTYADNVPSN